MSPAFGRGPLRLPGIGRLKLAAECRQLLRLERRLPLLQCSFFKTQSAAAELGVELAEFERTRGPVSSRRVPGGVVHNLPADLRNARCRHRERTGQMATSDCAGLMPRPRLVSRQP